MSSVVERVAPRPVVRTGIAHATQIEVHLARRSANSALAASAFLRRHERATNGLAAFSAPGAELSWGYTAGPTTVTLGYAVLGRRRSNSDPSADYQHLAAASAASSFGRVTASIASAYGHGMPLTSIVLDRPISPGPTPAESTGGMNDRAYFRIDALISAQWSINGSGRPIHLIPYVKLVNGLSRREALFYFQDGGSRNDPQPLAALAALPVVGLRWEF
jgi:hypothetical protein